MLTKTVFIKWYGSLKQYYVNKGYKFTKIGDEFEVKVEDLQNGNQSVVQVLCDYCLETTMNKEYRTYITQRENSVIHKDCCKNCSILKVKEGNLLTYGTEFVFQLPEVREKRKTTMINLYGAEEPSSSKILQDKRLKIVQEKYGVDNVFQLDNVKRKRKITMEEKYGNEHALLVQEFKDKKTKTTINKFGVEHAIQNQEVMDKRNATNIDKYGVENPLENEDIKEKAKNTCLNKYGVSNFGATEEHQILKKVTMMRRYGVEFSMQNPIILEKSKLTMFKNDTAPCSTQQRYLHNLLGGELNYPISKCSVDIAFPENKIYLEYNGGGHNLQVQFGNMTLEDFNNKEMKRYYFLKNKGWKQIIICSNNDYIPKDDVLLDILNYAKYFLNKGYSWIKFDINNAKIINSQGEIKVDFGRLRKISKNDLVDLDQGIKEGGTIVNYE